jgi:hypothetical protein
MKNTRLTIFLTFLFSYLYGQNNKDYSLYHDRILIIEECTSQASFDSSIIMYFDIFSKYNRVLAKDAYNACQIAALKKHKYFADFFYNCAKSGITKSKLLNNGLIQSEFVLDSIKLNVLYSKGNKEYLKRIDTSLRREMIQRYETEQKIKGKEGYSAVVKENFNRILDLAKQGRFPGEDLIGNSDIMESIVLPTLLHYPYAYKVMESYLTDALDKGKVTPLSLILLYDFNQTRTSVLYTSDIPVDTVNFKTSYNMYFGKQSYDFAEVNKQRAIKKIYSIAVQKNLENLNLMYGLDYEFGFN